jgi:prepilin-type N-terminal cleavage/methylation domain-containing protein
MLRFKMKTKQSGFTLIELMFTIVVLAILLGIGIPNFRDFIRNGRMAAQANDLLTGINVARSESVKRRTPVTLCSGADQDCDGGDFTDGWFVFVDTDGNGDYDAGEEILREHAAMPDGFKTKIVVTSDTEDAATPDYDESGEAYVSFAPTGFRRMGDGTLPAAMALVICDERRNVTAGGGPDFSAARALELSTTGRAAITRSKARITTLGDCP